MNRIAISSLAGILLLAILSTMVAAVGPALNAIPAQSVNEGSTFSITITATPPDNGSTNFNASITPAPSSSFLSSMVLTKVNNTQATLTGTPSYSDAGVYTVTITVSDADSSDAKSFTLTVNDVTPPGPQLVLSAIAFGDSDQVKSNPDADDTEDQDVYVTTTFTIQNTGGSAATGITLTPTYRSGVSADYNMTFTDAPATLATGESKTVTARIRVPEFIDAVDSTLVEKAMIIGQLRAASGSAYSTVDMSMQVKNRLVIKKIEVCHDDDCETVRDGDTVDKVKPGQHIKVSVTVENKYSTSSAEDIDIKDIQVSLDTSDDDQLDLSTDTEDMNDLGAREDDTSTLEFDVADDADGTATFTINVDGTDDFDSRHGDFADIKLDIERERHEISVMDIILSPETLSCAKAGMASSLNARVRIQNTGKSDEDEISLEVKLPDLNLGQITHDLTLDKDDDQTFNFNLNIPAGVKPGTYEVDVMAYINRDELSTQDSVTFTVPDCNANTGFEPQPEQPKADNKSEEVVVTTQPTTPGNTPMTPSTTVRRGTATSSFLGGNTYVMILLGVIVILVLIGAALIVAIARKGTKQP